MTSGGVVSSTTVAGGYQFYSYVVPDSGNYFVMATVKETSSKPL